MKISLVEAIDSTKKLYVNHLDGRILALDRPQNSIISPGEVMVVPGEGMPKKENPFFKGDLFIVFSVQFPQSLPQEVQSALIERLDGFCENSVSDLERAKEEKKRILDERGSKEADMDDEEDKEQDSDEKEPEVYECSLAPVNIGQFGKKAGGQSEAYHDEDEAEGDESAPRVGGCQQM